MTARPQTFDAPRLGTVLIAEDEQLVAMRLKKELEKLDLEVLVATTFDEACELLKRIDVHALIADIFLSPPKSDGLDLVQMAKDIGIPAVIMTSALDKDVAKQGLNQGADYLVEKPVDPESLKNTLVNIWENPRGLIARRERYFSLHQLTEKERELCRLILKGLSNQEIANISSTTVGTVKFYSSQIFEKFGVGSRAELFNLIFPT